MKLKKSCFHFFLMLNIFYLHIIKMIAERYTFQSFETNNGENTKKNFVEL